MKEVSVVWQSYLKPEEGSASQSPAEHVYTLGCSSVCVEDVPSGPLEHGAGNRRELGWMNRYLLPSPAPLFPRAPKEQAGTTELITTIQA